MDHVRFEGNETFSSRELKKLVKLREPFLILKSYEFNRRSLKLDAINIKNFYNSQGFLQATVEESFKVLAYQNVDIVFTITEGDRFFLRSVVIEGNSSLSTVRILKILGLRTGKPFNPVGLRQGFARLEREYGELGKILVKIEPKYVLAEEIDLTVFINEGPTVKIDRIVIEGLSKVDTAIVRRELRIEEGTVYNSVLAELTQRQIFETGLFSYVDIFPARSNRGEDWVNVQVELREFTRREILIEPGIGRFKTFSEGGEPISGLIGTLQMLDRSVFGSGSRLRVEGSIQFPVEQLKPEAIKRSLSNTIFRGEASLSSLWVGRWRVPNDFRLFAERARDLAFKDEFVSKFGSEWQGLHKFSEESVLRGGFRLTRIITTRKAQLEEDELRAREQERSLRILYRYRNVDNPIVPTRGVNFSIESSVAWISGRTRNFYRTGNDYGRLFPHYYRIEADYRGFVPLGLSRVFAFRVKLGKMDPFFKPVAGKKILDLVPRYDRFYLGGSTSLRGWESQRFQTYIDTLGNENAAGGLIKVLVNAEIRTPLWWLFGMDLFVDGGMLATDASEVSGKFQDWLRGKGWNYGVELTVSTPLGPIRLYYAIPFRPPKHREVNLGVPYAF